ncbi:hypothetical protein [Marivirga atlantica]|jgi:hypothetical protein|uniref:Uncharacterized protein n=1 Tax=Marivirga atlantica TaxID=1548457 RepID=A0A937DHX2_9BACT|nr:hypothetical protein [Marivirga atlantica]MBL0766383.1 hypothetical protein [Marivirga atlantica]
MKKLIILILVCTPFMLSAQVLTKKDLKDRSYGAKKLKKAPREIYINSFYIDYQTYKAVSASAASGFNKSTASIAVGMISELSPEDFQQITDKAYARAEKKLKEAGFRIVPAEEAKDIDMFKKLDMIKGGTNITGTSVNTIPSNKSFFYKPSTLDNSPKLSKQLGDIPVFELAIQVNFVELMRDNIGTGSTSVKGKVDLTFFPSISRVVWSNGGIMGAAKTMVIFDSKGRPIEIPGVIKSQKLKEYANAKGKTDYITGTKYNVKEKIEVSHPVNIDRDLYIKQVDTYINAYVDILVDEFLEYAVK